ncbi:putative hemolysin [Providencia alcalifaciens]|nr:putative hemolysin [Providencia alcalifaciens]
MSYQISYLLKSTFWSGLLSGAVLTLVGCGSSEPMKMTQTDYSGSQYAQQVVNLGPGVQEACVSAGGLPAINLELNGGQTAVCQFANGKRCAAELIRSGACI